jgi:ABC-type branched-subunit amino acid transport system ATPase component
MADDTILETKGLTKEFKGFVAVKDVNLTIRRGTIHALIGPNGAGKTTCFNLLTHFLTPTRGKYSSMARNHRFTAGGHRAHGSGGFVPDFCGAEPVRA